MRAESELKSANPVSRGIEASERYTEEKKEVSAAAHEDMDEEIDDEEKYSEDDDFVASS